MLFGFPIASGRKPTVETSVNKNRIKQTEKLTITSRIDLKNCELPSFFYIFLLVQIKK